VFIRFVVFVAVGAFTIAVLWLVIFSLL